MQKLQVFMQDHIISPLLHSQEEIKNALVPQIIHGLAHRSPYPRSHHRHRLWPEHVQIDFQENK